MLDRADGSLMAQRVPFNGTFTIDVYLMGRVQSRGARQNRGVGQVPCRAALSLSGIDLLREFHGCGSEAT
jgi:hypothetical protein